LGTKADDATRQRYRNIAMATDRLIAMLDDYLSPEHMAEVGARRRENTVGPRLLLEELVAQARVAGRPVTLAASDLPATLRGEPSGLRLALKVLLDNALRYTPAGTKLHVAGRRAEGGVELALRAPWSKSMAAASHMHVMPKAAPNSRYGCRHRQAGQKALLPD
jgi:signal transduction histidine kinase